MLISFLGVSIKLFLKPVLIHSFYFPQENSGEEQPEFKSRSYQDEILKACIERNTIIYLPTGAGKTYIAIMALKHFAKDLEK